MLKNLITHPAGIYLFKVNNRNTRTTCEICPKLTIKTSDRRNIPCAKTPLLPTNLCIFEGTSGCHIVMFIRKYIVLWEELEF